MQVVLALHKQKPPPGGNSAVRRWGSLRCSGYDFLQGVAHDRRSFSSLRKNQRGPEGVSQFIPPGDTPSGLPPFPLSYEGYFVDCPSNASRGRPVSGSLRWSPCAATERRTPELLYRSGYEICFGLLLGQSQLTRMQTEGVQGAIGKPPGCPDKDKPNPSDYPKTKTPRKSVRISG